MNTIEQPKSVLITGSSTGIGRELVAALLARGYRVIATMRRSAERSSIFREELERFGSRLQVLELDVASAIDRHRVAQHLEEQFQGKLDVLINNAGFGVAGALEELGEDQIRQQIEVNVFGLALTTQSLLPALRKAQGRIVNISSVLGYSGLPFYSLYCASKHAVEGLSESLAFELAPFGVQVALVEPGAHETKFSENLVWGTNQVAGNPYADRSRRFREAIHHKMKNRSQPSANVVLAVCDLLSMAKMRFRTRVGKDAQLAYIARRFLPNRWLTPLLTKIFGGMM
jgi:NAD(P)-dependent dehydrogenase (short-subunit alcohol dehydrogenase family)